MLLIMLCDTGIVRYEWLLYRGFISSTYRGGDDCFYVYIGKSGRDGSPGETDLRIWSRKYPRDMRPLNKTYGNKKI